MRFIIFCTKIALVTIEDLTGLFLPPFQSFGKEIDNIYVHVGRVFVEFVVLLTKIWPTIIDL